MGLVGKKICRIFGASLISAVPLSATLAQPATLPRNDIPAEQAPQLSSASVERIADLIHLWNYVRLFHVDERAMTAEWENALEEAAPAALAATDASFRQVAQRMMARIQPEPGGWPSPPSQPPAASATETAPMRVEGGVAVASCTAIANSLLRGQPAGQPPAPVREAMQQGVIFDCRGFDSGPTGARQYFTFQQWLANLLPSLTDVPIDRGKIRVRYHDGYPPDLGQTSGGYVRGVVDTSLGRIEPFRAGGPVRRVVFIVDGTTPQPWGLAGGLGEAGRGGLVAQGDLAPVGYSPFRSTSLQLAVRTSELIGADGRAGFRPEACVAGDADAPAMEAARALLAGRRGPACAERGLASRSPAAAPTASPNVAALPPAAGPGTAPPPPPPVSLGQRMVALAKLWGTIEYFFPYHDLTERPWSAALAEFVPLFAAAESREAYEDALMRLAQRTSDSHVGVGGLRLHPQRPNLSPPIYVRPVQGRFLVGAVLDPALADRIRVHDEIVSVDGKTVAERSAALAPYIAASTPQSLNQRTAGMLTTGEENSQIRLGLRRADGSSAEAVLTRSMRIGATAPPKPQGPSWRRIEPDIGYVNMETLTQPEVDGAIDALMDTRAIIFDLRNYPQGTAWSLAPRLALDGREGADAAQFRRPTYRGPGLPRQTWSSFAQQIPTGDKPRYRGKIVVLIDERAISQSEHTALFFNAAADPIFVGTPTTGANGDVTRVNLPGGLSVGFTGHDVRHADGTRLQRVGIQPDVVVAPTLAGVRAGRDEVLEAGLRQARARARVRD